VPTENVYAVVTAVYIKKPTTDLPLIRVKFSSGAKLVRPPPQTVTKSGTTNIGIHTYNVILSYSSQPAGVFGDSENAIHACLM